MSIQNLVAQIAVSNVKGATAWYGRLLGQIHGAAGMGSSARWRLPRGGWLQLRASRELAGASAVSLMVNDLSGHQTALEDMGLAFELPASGDAGIVATLLDPDGNVITLEQTLKASPEIVPCDTSRVSASAPCRPPVTSQEDLTLIASLHARIAQLEGANAVAPCSDAVTLTRSALSNAARH